MDIDRIERYCRFLVRKAVNLQKGQTLVLNLPAEGAALAPLCAEAAFDAGARDVAVHFADERVARVRMERAALSVLEDIKPWRLRSYMDYAEGEGGACVLSFYAQDPDLFKGIPAEKVSRAEIAQDKALRPWRRLTMGNRVQWCVASLSTQSWADKVFPECPGPEAAERLWQAILSISRITEDPAKAWDDHVEKNERYLKKMRALQLDSLHFTAQNGTDLRVGLAEGHVWEGFREKSAAGVPFLANVPTEEIFTAPHRLRTEGVVKSSLPYVYAGNKIEGITLRFEEGRVVEHSAEAGGELLGRLLATDEGACRLGEIALVPATSPVRQSGRLFYNTLYDENAACHMALGAGYPTTVAGGGDMDTEQLLAAGVNDSLVHEDIMIGTADMEVTGITKQGGRVPVFSGGEWALEGG